MLTLTVASRVQNSSVEKVPLWVMTNDSLALVQFLMDTCPCDKYPLYWVYIWIPWLLDYYEGIGNQSNFHPLLESWGILCLLSWSLGKYKHFQNEYKLTLNESQIAQSPIISMMCWMHLVSFSTFWIWTGIMTYFEKIKVSNPKLGKRTVHLQWHSRI